MAVRFQKFELGSTFRASVSLLKGTWLWLLLMSVPMALAAGAFDALSVPQLGIGHRGAVGGAAATLPGALSALAVKLFSAVFALVAELAAIAMLVAHAEGRSVSPVRAYAEALQRWPRAVRFNLYAGLQIFSFLFFCGFGAVWRWITLSLTNVVSFVKPIDSEPLKESDGLTRSDIWHVGLFVVIAWLVTTAPGMALDELLYILLKRMQRPVAPAVVLGGFISVESRALLQAFLVSAYYGLNASAGRPAPISRDLSRTP
jgi:hypothetical protein